MPNTPSPLRCQCREVLIDQVHQRISHPFRACPFFGTFTPMTQGPAVPRAYVEQRDNGLWHVVYNGTVVGRHRAQYKAREQADDLNTYGDEQ